MGFEKDLAVEFGIFLEASRKRIGKTQGDVAHELGIMTTESIRKWERGETLPDKKYKSKEKSRKNRWKDVARAYGASYRRFSKDARAVMRWRSDNCKNCKQIKRPSQTDRRLLGDLFSGRIYNKTSRCDF